MRLAYRSEAPLRSRAIIFATAVVLAVYGFPYLALAADQQEPIQGTWKGFYMCGQGATGLLLTISGDDLSRLTARFRFHAFPENPNVPTGEFELAGDFDPALGKLRLSPQKWIDHPAGYNMVGLMGSLQPDQTLQGTIDAPGCTRFALFKSRNITRTAALNGALSVVLVIAVPLAFVLSVLLLWLYLRAVKNLMLQRAEAGTSAPHAAVTKCASTAPSLRLEIVTIEERAKSYLAVRTLAGPWGTAAVYAIAGLGCAVALATADISASGTGLGPLKILVFTVYCAWPVVLTVGLVASISWRGWLLAAAVYFLVLIALVAVELSISEKFTVHQAIQLWLLINLPVNLIALASLARRIRAVGPIVLGFTIVAVAGWFVTYALIGNDILFRRIMWFGMSLGLKGLAPYYAVGVVGVLILSAIGWLIGRMLGGLYRAQWINDQSMVIDSIWLTFAFTNGMLLAPGDLRWFAAALAAIAVYAIVRLAGFALLRRYLASRPSDPKLLLLRVFSLGRRSEQLFDAFGKLWRYVGSIRLIAGPDLATTTIEPHEFLDFISGKLGRRFISGPEALTQRLAETEPHRDFDGRYRVNEFLCREDTWKMVLNRLSRDSDAVLMDLRGFSPRNSGCIFEINELLNVMRLDRVVFVIDGTTDEVFLRETFAQGWINLAADSPNREITNPRVYFFRLIEKGRISVRCLVRAVAVAADPT